MRSKKICDCYAYVGYPRYGSDKEALQVFDQNGIERAILVLGPQVPDLGSLHRLLIKYPDRFRGIGIPFGESLQQRLEWTERQLQAGLMGLRIDSEQGQRDHALMNLVGERGRWIFAVWPFVGEGLCQTYLDWLHRFPEGRIAASHFVNPEPVLFTKEKNPRLLELLQHPRFYGILSSPGAQASEEPFPHPSYSSWMQFLIDQMGLKRLMWGSEYPVLFWRDEGMDQATQWLSSLLPQLSAGEVEMVLERNASDLFFSEKQIVTESIQIPAWVDDQFHYGGTVPLLADGTLSVEMRRCASLFRDWVHLPDKSSPFATWAQQKLAE